MTKSYSVAEARSVLPSLLHEVESGASIEITRRGKPVAVVISVEEFTRLTEGGASRKGLWDAVQEWRATVDWNELGDIDEVFRDVRDRSPGRDVRL